MKIRRVLTLGLAAGALVLAGCSTSEDGGGGDGDDGGGGGSGGSSSRPATSASTSSPTPRPATPSGTVVKSGAEQAGEDYGVDVQYNSDPDPGEQSQLIDGAVADRSTVIVVSMANPDGLESSIKAAVAAGIPVITINSGIDEWQGLRRDHPRRPERGRSPVRPRASS